MSHMWADTEAELHAMARKLNMQRSWFQQPPRAKWKHYDISLSYKKRAIAFGAVLTDKYGAIEHIAKINGDEAKLRRIKALRLRNGSGNSGG